MEFRPDAYCGLYCASCTVFLATKNNTISKLAEEWGKNVNDITCCGCKSQTVTEFCRSCALKTCAAAKGLEFCIECDDFPCRSLENFKNDKRYPYHIEVYDSLKTIKEHGVEYWLDEMKKRWSCSQCGREHGWFTLECPDCGNKLNAYVKPE
jgi:hypothetical protein